PACASSFERAGRPVRSSVFPGTRRQACSHLEEIWQHTLTPSRFDFGPNLRDASCLFDQATQPWFVVVHTFEIDPPTGDFLGPTHLDIAVSKTSDPTGEYTIYGLPVEDDGTNGTPDHGCGGPCSGSYPRIGAHANGFYITTNEFALFGSDFHGAQLYAF